MDYMELIIFAVSMGTGVICGAVLGIQFLRMPQEIKLKPAKKKKRKLDKNEMPGKDSLLKSRMNGKQGSWTSFTCSTDHEDEESHIAVSRKKQNEAYRYAKRKKRQSK